MSKYSVKCWLAQDDCGAIRLFPIKPKKIKVMEGKRGYLWGIPEGKGATLYLNSTFGAERFNDNGVCYKTWMDLLGVPKKSENIIEPRYKGITKKEPIQVELSLTIDEQ